VDIVKNYIGTRYGIFQPFILSWGSKRSIDLVALFCCNTDLTNVIQVVLRSLREVVDKNTAEQGETKILMSLTGLPVADLADLYGDQIGKNHFLPSIIHGNQ